MALYSRASRLKDVIFSDPAVIPVINRLGVTLGVGDSSIEEVCCRHNVDADFFLLIVNTFLNEDYFPEHLDTAKWVDDTMRYLQLTDRFYAEVQLPNIERHLNLLVDRSGEQGNNLHMLKRFFLDVKGDFMQLASNSPTCSPAPYEEVADKIDDLLSFFVMHLNGKFDNNLAVAVVSSIFAMQKDMSQNNRIRRRMGHIFHVR